MEVLSDLTKGGASAFAAGGSGGPTALAPSRSLEVFDHFLVDNQTMFRIGTQGSGIYPSTRGRISIGAMGSLDLYCGSNASAGDFAQVGLGRTEHFEMSGKPLRRFIARLRGGEGTPVFDVANPGVINIGYQDYFWGVTSKQGGHFRIENGNILCVTCQNYGETVFDTDLDWSPTVWNVFEVRSDSLGENLKFYVDGGLVHTATANMVPAGSGVGAGVLVGKTAAHTRDVHIEVDWAYLRVDHDTVPLFEEVA